MSRLGSKLSKRIMAAVLSVAIIMSNMIVYATEISEEQVSEEESAEALYSVESAEINANEGDDGQGEKQYKIELASDEKIKQSVMLLEQSAEGETIKLNDVVLAIAEDGYEITDWNVTYTEGDKDVPVNVTYIEPEEGGYDDYSFVMPAADVLITPVIVEGETQGEYPAWTFNSPTFQTIKYDFNGNTKGRVYNGLVISAGAGAHSGQYLYGGQGHSISIPVSKPCTIKVTAYPDPEYCFEPAGVTVPPTKTEEFYDYASNKAGYVIIKTTADTYFEKIELSAPEEKYLVALDSDIKNAEVTEFVDLLTFIAANRTVKLSALADVKPKPGYLFLGWEVKQLEDEESVDVTYDETDGYIFTMPSAEVMVKPIIKAEPQERTVKVELKAGDETLTEDDLEDTVILFEDADNNKRVTVGTDDLDEIILMDGTYKVTVYNSKLYAVKSIDEFTVDEDSLTCTINFDKNPKKWDFSVATFQDYYKTGELKWYNGLGLTKITTNSPYAKLTYQNNSKIAIPVSGKCNVTVTYYGGSGWLGAKVGNKPYVAGNGDTSLTYDEYTSAEPGTVEIIATDADTQASVKTIEIEYPDRYEMLLNENDENATITAVEGRVTQAAEGAIVNLNKIATVEPNEGYGFSGWKVTYTDDKDVEHTVAVVKGENDNYTFTMPAADVIITPVVGKLYSITLSEKDEDDRATVTAVQDRITKAIAGAEVKLSDQVETVTITDADTYRLAGWKVTYTAYIFEEEDELEEDVDGDYTFKMPAADVTITPVIKEKGQHYTITPAASVAHATITPVVENKVENASEGETVKLSQIATVEVNASDADNFEHTGWKITYTIDNEPQELEATKANDGDYTFKMPEADVTVTPIISPKYTISLPAAETVANAEIKAVTGGVTKAVAGTVVELSQVATVETTDNTYKHTGWKVKYTVNGVDKEDELEKGDDGDYTFTMPEADVTVIPIIESISVERNITVIPKAGNETLTETDLEGTIITFTDADDESKKVTYKIGTQGDNVTALNAIKLEDGTYKVSVYNNKVYVKQPIADFEVGADNTTYTIQFDKTPKSWDFQDTTFRSNYLEGTTYEWYNGLKLTNVTLFANNEHYASLNNGSKIEIPVQGECNVTVTYLGGSDWLNASVEGVPYEKLETDDNEVNEHASVTYHYTGTEAGTVAITATGKAVVGTITITEPIAAPKFNPVNEDTTKSEYDFDSKTGEVNITTTAAGAVVKYVINKDFATEVEFNDINKNNILLAADKLKTDLPITVKADGTTIKAVAVSTDGIPSDMVSYTYNINENGTDIVPAPTATPNGGKVAVGQEIELKADGATIYYTIGGTTVTTKSPTYDAPIKLNNAGIVTINTMAVKDGVPSAAMSYTYTVVNVTKLTDVSIKGSAMPEKTLDAQLTFSPAAPSEEQTKIAYEWYKVLGEAEMKIDGAVESSYTVKDTDSNAKIRVKVIFIDELGTLTEKVATTSNVIGDSGVNEKGLVIKFNKGSTYIYTGDKITPSITVYNNGTPLVEGTDYTVKYTNNLNASHKVGDDGKLTSTVASDKKLPTVTVTGKGSLSKKVTANFNIVPKALDNKDYSSAANENAVADVKAEAVVVVSGKKATPVLLYGGTKLAVKKNFTYKNADDQGKKTWAEGEKLALDGTNNFTGSIELDVYVVDAAAQKNAKISAKFVDDKTKLNSLFYTGEKIMPKIVVSSKAKEASALTPGTDYVISYPSDTINVGSKKVVITGISKDCIGTVTLSYKIKPADSKNGGHFKVDGVIEPDKGGYDYVSTGVTFKLTGNGEDVVTVKYVTNSSDDTNTQAVSADGGSLIPGKDFKITYSNNKKAGTAKYTVTGLGNYKGVVLKNKEFTINPIKLIDGDNNGIDVTVPDVLYTKSTTYKSVPYVTVNGALLRASEYDVYYIVGTGEDASRTKAKTVKIKDENVANGSLDVTVEIVPKAKSKNVTGPAKGGTEKPLTGDFKIIKSTDTLAFTKDKDLSKAKITFYGTGDAKSKVGFTGEPVYPAKMEIKPSGGKAFTLDLEDGQLKAADKATYGFTLTYADNEAKGKATVVVKADGTNYVGGKSATFIIVAKALDSLDTEKGEGFIAITSFMKGLFNK